MPKPSPKYTSRHPWLDNDKRGEAAVILLKSRGVEAKYDSAKKALLHDKKMTAAVAAELKGFLGGLSWASYGDE